MGFFDRFEVVYEQKGQLPIKIIHDTKTDVRYLVVMSDGKPTAVTPLLNSDGKPASR